MLNQVEGFLVDLLVLVALQELYLIQALEKTKVEHEKQETLTFKLSQSILHPFPVHYLSVLHEPFVSSTDS